LTSLRYLIAYGEYLDLLTFGWRATVLRNSTTYIATVISLHTSVCYLLFFHPDLKTLGCGDVVISTISMVIALRRHIVGIEESVVMK